MNTLATIDTVTTQASTHTGVVERRGCRLAYDVRGAGPPVLMIQGVGLHGDGWRPQIDGLAKNYRCLSFDNRGMGRSQPVGTAISVAQMAEDALALMDAEGWGSAHVVGHSLGGLVAQHIALTARERVRSLALLCTFADGRDAGRLSLWMLWVSTRMRVGPLPLRRRAFLEVVMPPEVLATANQDELAAQLAPIFGHDLGEQPPIVMRQVAAMRGYNATPRLGTLAGMPTLVVSATHDRIAPPAAGRAIAAGIPGARYVEIAEAAHGVTIQCADQINGLLADHFVGAERS